MTSNMGSETILENFENLDALGEKHRADIVETTKLEIFDVLKESLRPEFLNRIDDKIMFLPLTKSEIKTIAGFMLNSTRKNLAKQELAIELSESALDLLTDLGYDPQFGARPLKRVIQKELVNRLAVEVIKGEFTAGETIYIGTDAKGFTFSEEPNDSQAKPKLEKKLKKSDVDKLKRATRYFNDAVDEVNKIDPQDN